MDIHAHIEFKDGSEWRHFGETDMLGRNYSIFSLLAGLRGPYEAMIDPRGLPSDRSSGILTYTQYWGDDGHTHSYLTVKELKKLRKKLKKIAKKDDSFKQESKVYRKIFKTIIQVMESLGEARLVFWFDN